MPKHTVFEYYATCLSLSHFQVTSGSDSVYTLVYIDRLRQKCYNASMNMNYNFPTATYGSISTQVYVFQVVKILFTIFAEKMLLKATLPAS